MKTAACKFVYIVILLCLSLACLMITDARADLSSGLVGWWKADGNANDSAGTNNGTLNGGVTFAAGKIGQALSFDGTGASVSVPAASTWALGTGDFTIAFWVYSATNDDHRPLINNRKTPASNGMWAIEVYPVANRVEFHSGLTIYLTASNLLTSSAWNHVAVTRSGSILSMYINGVSSGSVSNSSNFSEINDLQIGRDVMSGNDLGGRSFQGLMDEIRIYSRALSASEVANLAGFDFISQTGVPLSTSIVSNPITVTGISSPAPISISGNGGEYKVNSDSWTSTAGTVNAGDLVTVRQTSSAGNSTLTTTTLNIGGVSAVFNVTTAAYGDPNANGLVSWWRAENNAYDSIGGNNGTRQGGTTFDVGKAGQAFSFDGGAHSYVSVPNSSSIDYGPSRSFEMWIYPKVTAGFRGLLAKGYSTYSHIFSLLNGHLALYDGSSWRSGASVLSSDTWYHVVFVQNGSAVTMYLNGVPDGTAEVSWASTGDFLEIGSFNHSDYGDTFNGFIDEVKIFNRALSAGEVGKLSGQVPAPFSFTAQTGVAINTAVESNVITVTGITNPASISVTGGEYTVSADGGSTWSPYSATVPAVVNLDDQVKIRQTSSSNYSTTTTATLTIGGVSGTFSVTTKESRTLTTSRTGSGGGTVTSSPSGINCGSTCSAQFAMNDAIDVSASADTNSGFIGFSGDCNTNTSPCHITMDIDKAITARFDLKSDFEGNPLSGQAPHAVQFTDRSIAGATSWSWNFGDGDTSALQNPVHMYKSLGSYTVSLTANGSTEAKAGYVTVTTGCTYGPVMMGGTSYGTISGALAVALPNDVIKAHAADMGQLNSTQISPVMIQGGYDCGFNANPGFTIIQNSMTISGGTVTVEKIELQ